MLLDISGCTGPPLTAKSYAVSIAVRWRRAALEEAVKGSPCRPVCVRHPALCSKVVVAKLAKGEDTWAALCAF